MEGGDFRQPEGGEKGITLFIGGGRYLLSRGQRRRGRHFLNREQSRGLRGVITLFIRKVKIQLILIQDLFIRSNRAIFHQNLIQRLRARSNNQLRCRMESTKTHFTRLR
jgi:hypothetical protein